MSYGEREKIFLVSVINMALVRPHFTEGRPSISNSKERVKGKEKIVKIGTGVRFSEAET
jgi:hypothetical protein